MKILEFDPDRTLSFDPDRSLHFDPEDGVHFNPDRALSFDADRDLPFGKRGIQFRGFVCPECGAPVLPDQEKCDECGVKFAKKPPAKRKEAEAKKARRSRSSTTRPATGGYAYCPHCGVRHAATDVFCWNCGNAMGTSAAPAPEETPPEGDEERIGLGRRPVRVKVTKEWSETGYRKPEE